MGGVYIALLDKSTPSPLLPSDDKDPVKAPDAKADEPAKASPTVNIDTDGLPSRLCKASSRVGQLHPHILQRKEGVVPQRRKREHV